MAVAGKPKSLHFLPAAGHHALQLCTGTLLRLRVSFSCFFFVLLFLRAVLICFSPVFLSFTPHPPPPQLSVAHEHLHTIFDKLIQAELTHSRMLGTYYRVGFYGEKFGKANDGQEFIYKMPKITQLSEIVERLKSE